MAHHNHTQNHSTELSPALDPRNHSIKDYIPLIVIIGFILLSSIIYIVLVGSTLLAWFNAIMGFFFLYFALFKFIDLPGFAEGYHEYDLIANKFKAWGWVYPFIEVVLATLYLLAVTNPWLYIVTIIITVINVLGVSIKLARKEKFMCACLGTVLKVPLTTVTLIEYGLMGVMAIAMLFF